MPGALVFTGAALVGFLLPASAVLAAETIELAGPATRNTAHIDEIVVTARRREEAQLQVPLSVSAFTETAIQDIGLSRLGELARFTPGFSFDSATGRQLSSDRPNIRGLTTIRNGIANTSSASAFIDGIYVGGSVQSTALFNLERVEVVRGPQSALYGRGTYAGAINYVTRRPGEELAGEAQLTRAEHDAFDVTGWFGGPLLGETVKFYLAAGHSEYGGEYVNTVDGQTVGGERSDDVIGSLYWNPADSVDVALRLAWTGTDDEHFASYLQPRQLNNCCFRTPAAPRAREYYAGTAVAGDQVTLATDLLVAAGGAGVRLNRRQASLNLGWRSAVGYELRSLTGYISDELERGFDESFAAYEPTPFLPGLFTKVENIEQTDFSQELRLNSPVDQDLSWSLGMYYYRGDLEDIDSKRVFRDGSGVVTVAPSFNNLVQEQINNRALFGGAYWRLGDSWSTSLELRWARDEITVTNRSNDGSGAILPPSPFNATFDSLTPRFTLAYLVGDQSNYYFTVAKGSKPGTFNARVPDESLRKVGEEQVWSYELGAKNRLSERLTMAAAAYYMDVDQQQLTQLAELPGGATASLIQNIGRSAIWGVELEGSSVVTERLRVTASYAYTHAVYREHISIDEADLRGSDGSFSQTQLLGDVSGNRLPRTPEHTGSLVAIYEYPLTGSRVWYTNVDYSFESSKFAQEHNLISTGSRHIAGLRAGLRDDRWDLSLWVRNMFDDRTPGDIVRFLDTRTGTLPSFPQVGPGRVSSSPRGFALSLPRGRQFGATLRVSF